MLYNEIHYRILRGLDRNPTLWRSQLAGSPCVGNDNTAVRAPVERGLVKIESLHRSQSKLAYAYCLTPHVMSANARITHYSLRRTSEEYEMLRMQIAKRESEVGEGG
jgi:hypothetical protein